MSDPIDSKGTSEDLSSGNLDNIPKLSALGSELERSNAVRARRKYSRLKYVVCAQTALIVALAVVLVAVLKGSRESRRKAISPIPTPIPTSARATPAPISTPGVPAARLAVHTEPAGCEVEIDGVAPGRAPGVFRDVPVGWRDVRIRLPQNRIVVQVDAKTGASPVLPWPTPSDVLIEAEGFWYPSPLPNPVADANGRSRAGLRWVTGRAPQFSLVARTRGGSSWFFVGKRWRGKVGNRYLFLSMNDLLDGFDDNRGTMTVTITNVGAGEWHGMVAVPDGGTSIDVDIRATRGGSRMCDDWMEFVPVGDFPNFPDARTGLGGVNYAFRIGKYEVTVAQYLFFLDTVARDDPHGLYSPEMGTQIRRWGIPGRYNYEAVPDHRPFPVTNISWRNAARFCNWLHNGRRADPKTTEHGAYDATTFGRDRDGDLFTDQATHNITALFWIPTRNEWYKAAYFRGGGRNAGYWLYPMRTDRIPARKMPAPRPATADFDFTRHRPPAPQITPTLRPVGSFPQWPGPFGTFDMGGNVWEFIEDWEKPGYLRSLRGGSNLDADGGVAMAATHGGIAVEPTVEKLKYGFRVATIPPPESFRGNPLSPLAAGRVHVSEDARVTLIDANGSSIVLDLMERRLLLFVTPGHEPSEQWLTRVCEGTRPVGWPISIVVPEAFSDRSRKEMVVLAARNGAALHVDERGRLAAALGIGNILPVAILTGDRMAAVWTGYLRSPEDRKPKPAPSGHPGWRR